MQQSLVILDLCLWEIQSGKSCDYYETIIFEIQLHFQNVFHGPHEYEKLGIFLFLQFEEYFKMPRFWSGLVWTVGLTLASFSNSSWCSVGRA